MKKWIRMIKDFPYEAYGHFVIRAGVERFMPINYKGQAVIVVGHGFEIPIPTEFFTLVSRKRSEEVTKTERIYSKDPAEDFVLSVLDDDEGISLGSFHKLVYMLSLMDMQDLLSTLDDNIDIQDDRVFCLVGILTSTRNKSWEPAV